jgi:hypothetical protein
MHAPNSMTFKDAERATACLVKAVELYDIANWGAVTARSRFYGYTEGIEEAFGFEAGLVNEFVYETYREARQVSDYFDDIADLEFKYGKDND